MHINNVFNFIRNTISPKTQTTSITVPMHSEIDEAEKLARVSDCMASIGRAQVCDGIKSLSIDSSYLKQLTNKYSLTDAQIIQIKQDVVDYINSISTNLDEILLLASDDMIEEILAKKAVLDYLADNISYNKDFYSLDEGCGFRFGLPTKKISSHSLDSFQDEFNKSVSLFKQEGICSVSDYNPKKYQFDAEEIMKDYDKKAHRKNSLEYDRLFNPIARLKSGYYSDPYLTSDANLYRIISIEEFINLVKTKESKALIDSNGHYTNGHYSCITANPNYNEQAFAANGIPIRLKFKTKEQDGTYNMDLFNRISPIKEERSIYKVCGYNFDDIDWDNVCVNYGVEWEHLSKSEVDGLISQVLNQK